MKKKLMIYLIRDQNKNTLKNSNQFSFFEENLTFNF